MFEAPKAPGPAAPPLKTERTFAERKARSPISVGLNATAMILSRASLKVYHRYTVRGREHLPTATPFVLVANHSSHLDHMCLRNALPLPLRVRTHPLAAGDVFFNSAVRSVLSTHILNALPMWRKKISPHAMADLRERLTTAGCGFVLFPEGARTRDGNLLKFKAGVGMLVAGLDVPVIPCWIDGAFKALPAHAWIPRPHPLTVHIGPPLRFADHPNTREGWDAVIGQVEGAVRALKPS